MPQLVSSRFSELLSQSSAVITAIVEYFLSERCSEQMENPWQIPNIKTKWAKRKRLLGNTNSAKRRTNVCKRTGQIGQFGPETAN